MTIERIQAQTSAYARARTHVITQAAELQAEINHLVSQKHTRLHHAVRLMTQASEQLATTLQSQPELFPDGAKSIVIDGIKVGYQKGKDTVFIADEPTAIDHLLDLIADHEEHLTQAQDPQAIARAANDLDRLKAALKTKHTLIDAGLKRLLPQDLKTLGATLHPAADSVLIKPIEDDAMKAVQSLIKVVMAEVEVETA